MKSLILALLLMVSSSALAKSVCLVIEKSESGKFDRLVAQKTVEGQDAVVLHQYGSLVIGAQEQEKNLVIMLFDTTGNTTTTAAFGSGPSVGFIDFKADYGVVCERQ